MKFDARLAYGVLRGLTRNLYTSSPRNVRPSLIRATGGIRRSKQFPQLSQVSDQIAIPKTNALGTKVTVLGGGGGIGQSFCLLLKQSPLVTNLAIYDLVGAPGVAADLSHIYTRCEVNGYGEGQLQESLDGADIVVITAGKAQKPGMTREDLFHINAPIMRELVTGIATTCPKAMICIISDPVNHFVPIASEIMSDHEVLDSRRIFGVCSLDIMRASLFVAEKKNIERGNAVVPVIGGHSIKSTVPVFSQGLPPVDLTRKEQEELVNRTKNALYEVIDAKAGAGAATLSMAHSAYHFTVCLLEAMHGVPGVVECAFVRSDVTEAKYFSNPLLLGPSGVERNLGMGELNDYEKKLLKEAVVELKANIKAGEEWYFSQK